MQAMPRKRRTIRAYLDDLIGAIDGLGTAARGLTATAAGQVAGADDRDKHRLLANIAQSQADAVARDLTGADNLVYQLITLAVTVAGIAATAAIAVEQIRLSFVQNYAAQRTPEPLHTIALGRGAVVALGLIVIGAAVSVAFAIFPLFKGVVVNLGPSASGVAEVSKRLDMADTYLTVAASWETARTANAASLAARRRTLGLSLGALILGFGTAAVEFLVLGVLSKA